LIDHPIGGLANILNMRAISADTGDSQ